MTSLPTRSQLNSAEEFFASFAGSAYADGGVVEIDDPYLHEGHEGVVVVSERALQKHFELWLRGNWTEIVDYMVTSEFVLEDEPTIEDGQCDRDDAHGEHYWTDHLVAGSDIDYHCAGIKAHPNTAIGGRHDGKPAMYGQIDLAPLLGGE